VIATRPRARGFSLIELSVVVLIIGILLTMGISAMTASFENTALSTTSQRQAAIKEALIAYLRANSRLPCPDTDFAAPDGAENRATPGNPATACGARFGIIPYVTLGLARDSVRDGWGNFFSYHVANTAAANAGNGSLGTNTDWTITANFRSGNTGNITVNDRTAAGAVTALTAAAVVMVISHGRNGFGAYTIGGTRNTLPAAATGADELDNTNGTVDMVYYRRDPTTNDAAAGGAFDDVVLYLSASDLLAPLFRDGVLKSPAAQVSEDFARFKLAIIGFTMGNPSGNGTSSCNAGWSSPKCRWVIPADISNGTWDAGNNNGLLPYNDLGMTQMEALDPWGMRYRYQPHSSVITNATGLSTTLPAAGTTTTAFTIFSQGPNRADGGGDDISTTVSVTELRGYLATSNLIP
jgi:prepilin-type N-terminal cleavage/methylation domain-containing protein